MYCIWVYLFTCKKDPFPIVILTQVSFLFLFYLWVKIFKYFVSKEQQKKGARKIQDFASFEEVAQQLQLNIWLL